MIRRTCSLVLCCVLSLASTGCPAFWKVLPDVIGAVTKASQWLDIAEAAAARHFAAHPDDVMEERVARGFAAARSTLGGTYALARGAEHLDQANVDAAFADFATAYRELLALLGPLGIAAPAQGGNFMAAPEGDGPIMMPPAEAFVPEVQE